jgi:hypothetical protein
MFHCRPEPIRVELGAVLLMDRRSSGLNVEAARHPDDWESGLRVRHAALDTTAIDIRFGA